MKKLVLCYFALLLCTLSAVSLVAASSKNQLMPKTVKNIPNNSQLKFSEANEDDDDGEEEEGEDFDDYDNDDDDEDSSAEEQYQLKFKSRKLSRPAKINKAPAKSDIVLKQVRNCKYFSNILNVEISVAESSKFFPPRSVLEIKQHLRQHPV